MKKVHSSILVVLLIVSMSISAQNKTEEYFSKCFSKSSVDYSRILGSSNLESVVTNFDNISNLYFGKLNGFSYQLGIARGQRYFYDDKEFSLLNNDMEITRELYLNLPEYRDSREVIHFRSLANPENNYKFMVRKYQTKRQELDAHELFGMIKRSEREKLISSLSLNKSVNLATLQSVMSTTFEERVLLISKYGSPVATISMEQFSIFNFGIPNSHLRVKIAEKGFFKTLLAEERSGLKHALCLAQIDFEKATNSQFNETLDYSIFNELATSDFPLRLWFLKNPLLFNLFQALVLIFIGFLFIYLVLKRGSTNKSTRAIGRFKV